MIPAVFSLVDLTAPQDELLLPWLDLYETALPPSERVLVSKHLRALHQRAAGEAPNHILRAALDENLAFAGLLCYQLLPHIQTVYLWYLAVEPRLRGRGVGGWIYQQLHHLATGGNYRAVLFEVEIPSAQHSAQARRSAQRRITFYRRLGAHLLGGVDYMQSVGHNQPPVPMHIMLHPLQPLTAAGAFELARALFRDAVKPVGPLTLD